MSYLKEQPLYCSFKYKLAASELNQVQDCLMSANFQECKKSLYFFFSDNVERCSRE